MLEESYKKFILYFFIALVIGFFIGVYVVWRDFPL